MTITALLPIGDSLGIELPADILARLGLKLGDKLVISETDEGALRIVRAPSDHDEQMRFAGEGMRDYRNALSELAK